MEPQYLKVLRLMLELTKEGRIKWRKVEFNNWVAKVKGNCFLIQFIFFARTDDVGSDRTMARVTVDSVILDYCIGTEGFELACEMLSIRDKDWAEWRAMAAQRLQNSLEFLQGLKRK